MAQACDERQLIPRAVTENMRASRTINVGTTERVASLAAGGLLLAAGMRRGDLGGSVLALLGANLIGRGASGYCMVSAAIGRDTAGPRAASASLDATYAIRVDHVITVNRPIHEVYATWRDFEAFPRFMQHIERVTRTDERHSHWVARAPLGKTVEWDAVLVNDETDRVIAWRSLPGSDIRNAGSVRFLETAGGTEIRVTIEYQLPGGVVGQTFARMLGEDPSETVMADLRRFKTMIESPSQPPTVPTSEARASGR